MTENKKSKESDDNETLSYNSIGEDDEFEPEKGNEEFQDYKVDGYHPVELGEIFNSKYQVIQKLGWGFFSTVWLVNEKNTSNYYALKIQKSKQNYSESALDEQEILKALALNENNPEWHEIIAELNRKYSLTLQPTDTFNISLYDNFCHFGMHGQHYCSIFEIMGPNLLDIIQFFEFQQRGMDIRLVKIITRQVLMGLDYMHRICKVIHTDLKPENIMLQLQGKELEQFIEDLKKYKKKPLSMKFLKNIQASSENKQQNEIQQNNVVIQLSQDSALSALSQQGGVTGLVGVNNDDAESDGTQTISYEDSKMIEEIPSKNKIETQDVFEEEVSAKPNGLTNMQTEEAKTNETNENSADWSYTFKWKNHVNVKLDRNMRIKIVDFGNACWVQRHFTDNIQTREYRSPEVILGMPYKENTDIWSLACCVFEMLTSNFLFKPQQGDKYGKDDDHLALILEHLGKMPLEFLSRGKNSFNFFNKNGQLLRIKKLHETSIKDALMEDNKVDEEEAEKIEKFLLPMLEYDPEKRISAYEALQSEWLWS